MAVQPMAGGVAGAAAFGCRWAAVLPSMAPGEMVVSVSAFSEEVVQAPAPLAVRGPPWAAMAATAAGQAAAVAAAVVVAVTVGAAAAAGPGEAAVAGGLAAAAVAMAAPAGI